MARKPLFDDIEDGFLRRRTHAERDLTNTTLPHAQTAIPHTQTESKVDLMAESVSKDDGSQNVEKRLEDAPQTASEENLYFCRGEGCTYRGKAIGHWKTHARHRGHLAFGCNLVQGDSATYIPYDGDVVSAEKNAKPDLKDRLDKPWLRPLDVPTNGAVLEAMKESVKVNTTKTGLEKTDITNTVRHMTKYDRALFSEHPAFLKHWERHWKDRSRITVVTCVLMLFHAYCYYADADIGYNPQHPINIVSLLLILSVMFYVSIAFYDSFPWDNPGQHAQKLRLLCALGIFSKSPTLQFAMYFVFLMIHLNDVQKVSVYVFLTEAEISGLHRLARAFSIQAVLAAFCSFLLAMAESIVNS
jgi:hypothetical protein